MASRQVGYVELFEIDFSIERSHFGVLEIFPSAENFAIVATDAYDPSAPAGSQFRPAIAASTGHGPVFPDGGRLCIGYVAVDADAP